MKIKKKLFKIIFFIIFINIENNSFALTKNKIIANVDNRIISSYELKNKVKTILFLANQNINQENINLIKNKALQELIDYKLKKNQVIKSNIQGHEPKNCSHHSGLATALGNLLGIIDSISERDKVD